MHHFRDHARSNRLAAQFHQLQVWLEEGEFLIVPRGVEHRPAADEEVHVLLFEPAGTLNTGDAQDGQPEASRIPWVIMMYAESFLAETNGAMMSVASSPLISQTRERIPCMILRIRGGFAMGMFGPSKEEIWRQLSDEIGGEVVEGGFWKGKKIQSHVGPWTITLDTYTESTGESSTTYTRMRAPFVNPEGFRFTIYRKSAFSGLGKMFGMQDIEIGESEFDEAFIIQGTDETKVRDFFADPKLQALIQAQPKIRLKVKDSEGWFGPSFPDDVDELHFQVAGVIKDLSRLKGVFDLFAAVLDRLCKVGSAYKSTPDVEL